MVVKQQPLSLHAGNNLLTTTAWLSCFFSKQPFIVARPYTVNSAHIWTCSRFYFLWSSRSDWIFFFSLNDWAMFVNQNRNYSCRNKDFKHSLKIYLPHPILDEQLGRPEFSSAALSVVVSLFSPQIALWQMLASSRLSNLTLRKYCYIHTQEFLSFFFNLLIKK